MKESDFVDGLISVIVPVYNVEKYVGKCIESIINQTYKNLEIILVDDGSSDNSGKICDGYAGIDSRIIVIHKKNAGLSEARNSGLDKASGEYVMFVDSDDYIDIRMLEVMYKRICDDNSDICVCNFVCVDENDKNLKMDDKSNLRDDIIYKDNIFCEFIGYAHAKYIVSVCKLYKMKLFNDLRFVRGKCNEDEFMANEIYHRCDKISTMQDSLYFYLKRNNSIMNSGFSIKRMDAVEAILNRTKTAIDKGIDVLAEASFINAMEILAQGYINLDRKDFDVKIRLEELKGFYNELYPVARKTIRSNKWKLLLFMFYVSPQIYVFLCYVKRRILK